MESSDPVNPKVRLKVNANVVVELGFERSYLRFPNIKKGESLTQRMKVLAKNPKGLKLSNLEVSLEGASAKIVKEKDDKGVMQTYVEVTVKGTKIGNQTGRVSMKTNNPKVKELTLRFNVAVEGEIQVVPRRLTLRIDEEDRRETTATVQSNTVKFKIKNAQDPSGRVLIKVDPIKKGTSYRLTVSLNEKAELESGRFTSNVIIATDNKDQPTLTLPVYLLSRTTRGKGEADMKKPHLRQKNLSVKPPITGDVKKKTK